MKLLDIALKDMRQSFRSLTGIMFMFVVPILVTALFAFMFGAGGDEADFELPQTQVRIVNLDSGSLPANVNNVDNPSPGGEFDFSGFSSMGELLLLFLQDEALAELMSVSTMDDPVAARLAVDNQEANVAIIIPANFTDALLFSEEQAVVELYQDPTLTIGPAIVASTVQQFLDGFAATTVGTAVVMEQLSQEGVPIDDVLLQQVVGELSQKVFAQVDTPTIVVRPPDPQQDEGSPLSLMLGQILTGMMIFFAFFTGAGTLQTILTEEEKGTLARLFTTPTPISTILGGKLLGTLITLTVQVTILLIFGYLVFGIRWGEWLTVSFAAANIVALSAATGLLLASIVRSARQSGVIYGGVLTITGMVGIFGTFIFGGSSSLIETITLFVPQGWAVRGLQTAMQAGQVADLLPTLAGSLVWIILMLAIGQRRLARRFA